MATGPVLAQSDISQGVLRGAYVAFPPLTYTDEDGYPAGSLLELANQIATATGYHIDWQEMPVRRIHEALRAGHVDIWPTTAGITEIQPWVRETSFPDTPLRLSAFRLADTPPVSSTDDMMPAAVILLRGYTYLGAANQLLGRTDEMVSRASDHKSALRMLANGRGDYLLDFDVPVDQMLAQEPVEGIERNLIAEFRTSYVFSRKTPQIEKVIESFEQAWRAIEQQQSHSGPAE